MRTREQLNRAKESLLGRSSNPCVQRITNPISRVRHDRWKSRTLTFTRPSNSQRRHRLGERVAHGLQGGRQVRRARRAARAGRRVRARVGLRRAAAGHERQSRREPLRPAGIRKLLPVRFASIRVRVPVRVTLSLARVGCGL